MHEGTQREFCELCAITVFSVVNEEERNFRFPHDFMFELTSD